MAPRLRGIKQKKSHRGSGMNILFPLFYYSPKPRNQVRILIYRNWSIYTEREDQPSPPEREREVFVRAWERFDCHEVRAKIE